MWKTLIRNILFYIRYSFFIENVILYCEIFPSSANYIFNKNQSSVPKFVAGILISYLFYFLINTLKFNCKCFTYFRMFKILNPTPFNFYLGCVNGFFSFIELQFAQVRSVFATICRKSISYCFTWGNVKRYFHQFCGYRFKGAMK